MNNLKHNRNLRLFSLQLVFTFFVIILLTSSIIAQEDTDLSMSLNRYLGVYMININGEKPDGFKDFESFFIEDFPNQNIDNPEADNCGRTFVTGNVKTFNGTVFRFSRAFLQKRISGEYQNFEFKTSKIKGIYYTFNGKFLDQEIQEIKGGSYTKVRGVLSKYKDEKKIFSLEMPFASFSTD